MTPPRSKLTRRKGALKAAISFVLKRMTYITQKSFIQLRWSRTHLYEGLSKGHRRVRGKRFASMSIDVGKVRNHAS